VLAVATIRKRGTSWHVQIRIKGYPTKTGSFDLKSEATAWARDTEKWLRATLAPSPQERGNKESISVSDLLDRYDREITPRKKGAKQESQKIVVLKRADFCSVALSDLSPKMIAAYRDKRLRSVTSGTVRRELALLSHCFEIARKEWGTKGLNPNPVKEIVLPSPGKPRDQRLPQIGLEGFWKAVEEARADWVKPFIILAIETGMRRGELLSLTWNNVNFRKGIAFLPDTKNGSERTVPLTPKAIETLQGLPRDNREPQARVFTVSTYCVRQGVSVRRRCSAGDRDGSIVSTTV